MNTTYEERHKAWIEWNIAQHRDLIESILRVRAVDYVCGDEGGRE